MLIIEKDIFFGLVTSVDKEKILSPHEESHSDLWIPCSNALTAASWRLHGEQGLL